MRTMKPRRKRAARPLLMESLETRRLMTRRAILDFDGESLTAAQMTAGGWGGQGATTVDSFRDLFTAAHDYLDVNDDGLVNVTDANLAINRIVSQVRFDYMAYDLNIIVGDQDTYQPILTDGTVGDVMVIITGDDGFLSAGGVAPWSDIGNEDDEIVWGFGGNVVDGFTDPDRFINRMARVVSHEMGHAFGLGHVIGDPDGDPDALTHHTMGYVTPDTTHDFNFHDHVYDTDVFDYAHQLSAAHPEWNVAEQNAHELLSHPDVLGPSPNEWLAVLKPGELTIVGDNGDNDIKVDKGVGNRWVVTLDGKSYTIDTTSPSLASINPFDATLNKIRISGKGGNDDITVTTRLNASISVDGGTGDDHLKVDDGAYTTPSTYKLQSASLVRTGSPTISYSVEDLSLQSGSGADTFNIESTRSDGTMSVYGGDGNDTFNVTPVGRDLDDIAGPLNLFGQNGADRVNIHDQNNAAGTTYTLSEATLKRTGAATITYSTDEALTVNGGSANNVYAITGSEAATPMTVNGGAGNDTFIVGNADPSLDPIKGALTLAGKGGSDSLVLRDWGSGAGRGYTLADTSVAATGVALIKYSTMETLQIHGTAFNDTLTVNGTPAGLNVWFAGNGGSDTLVGRNADNAFNITGFNTGNLGSPALSFLSVENLRGRGLKDTFKFSNGASVSGTIDGQGGVDTLDYSLYAAGVSVNLGAGTATGTGGIASIENVYGGSGNDTLTGNASNNILWGNAGNDVLLGLGGDDVLSGGNGDDVLVGGTGRDLLIGGRHKDDLSGGAGDDILIGARCAYEANLAAQQAIMLEWSRLDAGYNARVNHLKVGGAGALNGATLLNLGQVFDDAISDTLNGETNNDWFFATALDVTDKVAAEILN